MFGPFWGAGLNGLICKPLHLCRGFCLFGKAEKPCRLRGRDAAPARLVTDDAFGRFKYNYEMPVANLFIWPYRMHGLKRLGSVICRCCKSFLFMLLR